MQVQDYIFLIEKFLDRSMSVQEFERQYLDAFKGEQAKLDPQLFEILDKLFSDVDSYSPNCMPGEETEFRISEQKLREEAEVARNKLREALSA